MSLKANKPDPDQDPCINEQLESTRCMAGHGYNREVYKDKCREVFENVTKCKKFWSEVKMKRIQQKVKPQMPPQVQQEKLKEILGDNLPYVPL